ncbi:MAG: PaaI family thioesterase [Pseudomonadota bacterium]
MEVPAGFRLAPARGAFTDVNGPFYRTDDPDHPRFGFVAEQRHCNGLGLVHGGMIATFLDSAMAQSLFDRHARALVTVELAVRYERPGLKGRWLEADIRFPQAPLTETVTAEATLRLGRHICAEAIGTYKLLNRRV